MKLQKISYLMSLILIASPLYAMEERPTGKSEPLLAFEQEAEQLDSARVLLQLMDGNEVIYAIEVPQLFAKESSVINNNLAFQEEEEETLPKVQFDVSTVSIRQFDALQLYITENYKQRNIKKTLDALLKEWYPDNVTMFVDLLTIANFIGNEHLYNACLKKLYEILEQAFQEKRWNIFFKMPDLLKAFDLQEDLKKTIVESLPMSLFQHLNREKKIGRSSLYSLGPWNEDEWLAVQVSTQRKKGSASSTVRLKTLPNNTAIATFKVPFNKDRITNPFFFSPLQKVLYVIGGNIVALYQAETGELITEIEAPSSVSSISFDRNNTLLAVAMYKKVIIYDLATKEVKKEFDLELSNKIALAPNGNSIAFQKKDGAVEIWDFVNEKPIASLDFKAGEFVLALQFLNDNHSLVIASSSGEVEIFNIIAQQAMSFTRKGNFTNATVAISSDDRLLATFFEGEVAAISGKMIPAQGIIIVDLQSKAQIKRIKVKKIKSLKFSQYSYKLVFEDTTGLYQIDLFPKKIKRLNLHEILLFWYLIEQEKNNQPLEIPEEYNKIFEQLPKKVKKYLRMNQLRIASEEREKETIQRKEKRKEPEKKEKEKEKKDSHKRFKRD